MNRDAFISPEEWELHKDIIYDFYINHDLKLKDVILQMHRWFSFQASESQYKRKLGQWRFVKNQRREQTRAIDRYLKQHKLDHTSVEISVGGRQLSPGKLQRALRRHVLPSLHRGHEQVSRPLTPVGICIKRALLNPSALSSLGLPGFQLLEKFRSIVLSYSGPSQPFPATFDASTFQGSSDRHVSTEGRHFATDLAPFSREPPYTTSNLPVSGETLLDSSPALVSSLSGPDHNASDGMASILVALSNLTVSGLPRNGPSHRLLAFFPAQNPDHVLEDLHSRLCTPGLAADLTLIGYVIYLCSNNLVRDKKQLDTALELLFQNGNKHFLSHFNQMGSRSLRRVGEYLLLYAARNDRLDLLDILKDAGMNLSRPVQAPWPVRTALQEAIIHRNEAFCKRLIEDGVDVDDSDLDQALFPLGYQTTIDLAARYMPEIFRFILDRRPDVDINKIFPAAVKSGADIDTIRVLLERGADINALDGSFQTALQHAIEKEEDGLVWFLLDNGALIEGPDIEVLEDAIISIPEYKHPDPRLERALRTPTPLGLAAKLGNAEICGILLEAGAAVNATLYERGLHLLEATGFDTPVNRVFHVLNRYFLQNCRTDQYLYEFPALVLAILEDNVQIVKLLLKYGADVHQTTPDKQSYNPLQVASWTGNIQIISVLLEAGADINADVYRAKERTALQCAVRNGKLGATEFLLGRGADVNAPCAVDRGVTALQAAALEGHEPLVDVLLRANADVNAPPSKYFGYTALAAAIKSGCDTVFWRLIEAGADPTIIEWENCDNVNHPFLVAVETGSASFAMNLVDFGLNINTPLSSGYSLAEKALLKLRNQASDMLALLLQLGIFSNTSVFSKALQSYISGDRHDISIIRQLLDHGADPNEGGDGAEFSVLEQACVNGHFELVRYLVQRGADVNPPVCRVDGYTALKVASSEGYIDIVSFLLEHGADVNVPARGEESMTALQAAAMYGYVRIAQMLIAAGADVGAKGFTDDDTAINHAARSGGLDMVKLLLDNYQVKESESMSDICAEAAEYAREECHWEVADLLENYQQESESSTGRAETENVVRGFVFS